MDEIYHGVFFRKNCDQTKVVGQINYVVYIPPMISINGFIVQRIFLGLLSSFGI